MTALFTREIVNRVTAQLHCEQRLICTYLGITETELAINIDKPFSEIKKTKIGKRIFNLYYVVSALSSDLSLNAESLIRTLTSPHYEMEDGTFMDVIAGIHAELPYEFLVTIAEKALADFRKEYKRVPKSDDFYRRVSSA